MANKSGGDIKFRVNFQANQTSLNELKKSLQDLQKIKIGDFNGSYTEFSKVKQTVTQLDTLINKAFNPTLNTSNIASFRSELEKSGMSLKQIQSDLNHFGPAGQRAFNQMTTSVLATNLQLKETNSLIDSMGKTMVNTVKWGIASSIMNTFTQSVQGAFQYVQSLEKSLTNIRIVTGDSTEKMAQFAQQANKSAQALGRSTLDYSKASLTFYQQGLNDEDVQARTEATLKAQNITGAGSQMADYLTAVWNGYKVANEEAELYVDKLAAVADSSASDMSQLAVAMSKVASTANNMGVDIDQLNAQIATVVATTRQAPESVGTAFKTIYTRMNDIKAGLDEAEISLGNYSGKMAQLGVNVLDATGHLRDTGQVMDQIGERWATMTKQQQVYLAQTMGGQRQVNQLMALFDNWTTYSQLLNTSLEAEGTLAEKNSRYMESLGAKMEQLGAAGERVKAALIDSDSMKSVIDALISVTNLAANLFETMGSGNTVLLALGSTMTQLFSGTIAKEINNIIVNMQNAKSNAEAIRQELELTKEVQQVGKDTPGGTVVTDRLKEFQQYYSVLDESSINNYKNLLRQRGAIENEIQTIKEAQQTVINLTNAFKQGTVKEEDFVDPNRFRPLNDAIGETQTKIENVKDLFSKNLFENWNKIENIQDAQKLVKAVEEFREEYQKINPDKAKQLLADLEKLNSGNMSPQRFGEKLQEYLVSADTQAKKLTDTVNNSAQALSNATGKASTLDGALQQTVNSAKQLFDITNAVKFISALGQISSTLMTIQNLGSIWKDKDVSTGEKILKTVTTMGFVLPTLYSSFKNMSTAIGLTAAVQKQRLLIKDLQIAKQNTLNAKIAKEGILRAKNAKEEKIRQLQSSKRALTEGEIAMLEREQVELKGLYNQLEKETLSLKAAQTAQEQAQSLLQTEQAGSGLATAVTSASESASSLMATIAPFAPIILGIVAALGGVAYFVYKDFNKAKDAAEEAEKAAQDAKEQYDNLKESFKNLTSAISDYKDAQTALKELTTGTEEWYDAVNDLNDKVLELIDNFPQLAKYLTRDENGVLSIGEQGLEEAKNKSRQGIYAGAVARANLQENAFQAKKESKITDEGRRIYGAFGGPETLNKIMEIMQNQSFSGREELEKSLRETNSFTESQIAATVENSGAIYQLIQSLKAQQFAIEAAKDTYLTTSLQNEELYQKSSNKQAFADMMSGIIDQGSKELDEKYYKDPYTKYTLDRDALFDRYEEIYGKSVKETGLINKKIEVDGKETSIETIGALVAAADSLQHSSEYLEGVSKRLEEATENFKGESDEVKQLLFNRGLAGGFDSETKQFIGADVNSLSTSDVEKIQNLDPEKLASYFDISSEEVTQGLQNLKISVNEGLDNFINGIDHQAVRVVMNQLKEQYGPELSRDLAETIAQNVQDGYQKAGTKSGNSIRDFYKQLQGDQVEQVSKLVQGYNFASGSAENFRQSLEQVGIKSGQISDTMVQKFYEAQKKIQGVKASEARVDPGKVAEANSTASLGTKLNQGQKLSKKELASYKEGLEDILKIYPELNQQVGILNNTQLTGSQMYTAALRDVKLALMSSYIAMGESKKISQSEFTDQIMTLVTDTELLQDLAGTNALNNEQYNQVLQNLAMQYDSCRDELAKYNEELRTGTQESAEAAAQSLMLATRSAENANKYGIEAQQISTLANHYVELAKSGNQAYEGMDQNSKLAVDAATRYIRLNEAVETLEKDYTNVTETLTALQNYDFGEILGDAEYAKTYQEIKKAVEDIVGIEEGLLDDNFIKQHADQIKDAAGGSEKAIIALQEAAAEEIWVNVNLDDEKFKEATDMTKQEFADWINNLPQGELSVDDTQMLETLANTLLEAGYTVEDLQEMFQGAHLNVDMDADPSNIIEAAQEANKAIDSTAYNSQSVSSSETQTDQQESGGYELIPKDQHGTFQVPLFKEDVTPFGVIPSYAGLESHPFTYTEFTSKPDKQTQDVSHTNTITGVKINRAGKAPVGGQVSHRNKNGGNKKHSGSGGRNGGGGKGKGSTPKAQEPKHIDPAKGKTDRYRKVNIKAKRQADSLSKLKKQQEQLTGEDVTKNLEKQLKILKKQEDTIREKLNLQRNERDQLKDELAMYGATYDKNNTLKNYDTVASRIRKQYNEVLAWYNKLSPEQQNKKGNQAIVKKAEEKMKQKLEALQRYDTLNEKEIQETLQKYRDNVQAIIDNQVQTFHIKMEAVIDFKQAKTDLKDFIRDVEKEVREDDVKGLNSYRFSKLGDYLNNQNTGSIQQTMQNLKTALTNKDGVYTYESINPLTHEVETVTDTAKQQQDIQKYTKELEGQMRSYQDIIKEIKESIFDMIEQADKAFKEQMEEYQFIQDLVDHNVKVTQLLFGDEAYDKLDKYYKRIEENNNQQLDFFRQRRQMWYGRMMEEQARMQQLDKGSNEYKEAEERFKEYQRLWRESQKDLNAQVEKSIQNLQDKYANAINNIFTQMELSWTDGLHLDTLQDEWDKINDLADMYLDKVNGIYQIDKLENAFQDAIDNAEGSLSAQQSLNDLMNEQLGYLRDKDRLTQYDVDRANALLQIEIKRLALQQSRNSKTKLRLRRDSQGNYSYQYVANQEENNKAQQELADAQNSLYNTTKEATKNNLSDIVKTVQEAKEKMTELYQEDNRDTEQWQIKKANLEQYYTNKINGLLEQNTQLRNNLMQDSFDQLARMYGINAEQFNAMTQAQKNSIMTNLFPQWGSLAQQMADTLKSEGGFYETIVGPIQAAAAANKEYKKGLNDIQKYSGQNLKNIINDTDKVILQAEKLLDNNKQLVTSYQKQIEAVQGTLNATKELYDFYEKVRKSAAATVEEGYTAGWFKPDEEILGINGEKDAAARKAEYDETYKKSTKASQTASDLEGYTPYKPSTPTTSNLDSLLGSTSPAVTSSTTAKSTGSTPYPAGGGVLSTFNYGGSFGDYQKTTEVLRQQLTEEYKKAENKINSNLKTVQSSNTNLESVLKSVNSKMTTINANVAKLISENKIGFNRVIALLDENNHVLEQKVDINATFPSLVQVRQIQNALLNLTNMAAQAAAKNKASGKGGKAKTTKKAKTGGVIKFDKNV